MWAGRGGKGHLLRLECQAPTGKYRGSVGVGKLSFCNPHGKD